jgi:hypothetical protein
MSSQHLSDEEAPKTVRLLMGEVLICGDPLMVSETITFLKGEPKTVTAAVARWALGLNASRQAEVFELVEEVESHG